MVRSNESDWLDFEMHTPVSKHNKYIILQYYDEMPDFVQNIFSNSFFRLLRVFVISYTTYDFS